MGQRSLVVLVDYRYLYRGARHLLCHQEPHDPAARVVDAVGGPRRDEDQISAGNSKLFFPHDLGAAAGDRAKEYPAARRLGGRGAMPWQFQGYRTNTYPSRR